MDRSVKPRVAVLIYSLAAGGAERVVSLLLPELMRHYEVTLVLMNETIFYEVPEGVKIHYLERSRPDESGWKKFVKLPWLAWRYRNLLCRRNIEISLSLMTRPNYVNLLAKKLGGGAATIISERSYFSLQYADTSLSSRINRSLVRLYNGADMIVTNSVGNRIDLEENFGLGVPMHTIPNPVDLPKIDRLASEEIPLSKDRFTFISVGRMDEGKNHRLLLESMRKVDVELWLIGEGPLRSELERLARMWGIEDRVRFLGRQSNPFAYLARADAFVFASKHEGFPNVLLEALACALPVISTDCPSGPREILAPGSDLRKRIAEVEYGSYGVLVPPDDGEKMVEAMDELMKNDTIRQRYIENARNRAMDFSIEKIVPKWVALLGDIEIRRRSKERKE